MRIAPGTWATTQSNLGNALLKLGERKSGMAHLEEAVKAIESARNEFHRADTTKFDAYFDDALKSIAQRIDERRRISESPYPYAASGGSVHVHRWEIRSSHAAF